MAVGRSCRNAAWLLPRLVASRITTMLSLPLVVISVSSPASAASQAPSAPAPAFGSRRVHTTALAIVPPDECWPQIQAARTELQDAGLYRWPPHINLIYPFIEPIYFERFADAVAPALATVPPFRLRLGSLDVFGGTRHGVLWLDPSEVGEPTGRLDELYRKVCEACPDAQRSTRPFRPHLTITHTSTGEAARELAARMQHACEPPVEFEVLELLILARKGPTDPFERAWRLPLGPRAAAHARVPGSEARFLGMPTAESDVEWRAARRRPLQDRVRARGRRRAAVDGDGGR